MDHNEILAMLDEMDIPYAYDHFAEGESPQPPFICFLYPDVDMFSADNVVYFSSNVLNLELYTDYKSIDLEKRIEEILTEHELYYEKTETWIDSEKLYEVLYTMAV